MTPSSNLRLRTQCDHGEIFSLIHDRTSWKLLVAEPASLRESGQGMYFEYQLSDQLTWMGWKSEKSGA